jgi:hypothetical protein
MGREGPTRHLSTDFFFFASAGPGKRQCSCLFLGGGFYVLFCFNFFFDLRGLSVGENPKTRGPSPEMPKTGSPLAKGGLMIIYKWEK